MRFGQVAHETTYSSNFGLVQNIFIAFLFEPIQNIPIGRLGHRNVCWLETDKFFLFVKIPLIPGSYFLPAFPLVLLPELLPLFLNFIGKKNCNV